MRTISIFALAVTLAAVAHAEPTRRLDGVPVPLGNGAVASYAELDGAGDPHAIGVALTPAALAGLPAAGSDLNHCYDQSADGRLDPSTECSAWHERVLPLPSELARRADVPFKWALLNWNPGGHLPPGVFDKPHFDVHFYIEPIETILAIQRGSCGVELVRCDQFAVARRPVAENFLPAAFTDLGLVAPAMGNHLIDPGNANFHGEPFTRHWVYGTWDGRVAFWEEMLALTLLQAKPEVCYPIATPPAYAVAGWYPTQSCIRYNTVRDEYTVSLEGFEERAASSPGAARAVPPALPGPYDPKPAEAAAPASPGSR
jgi:hypothetical protein